MVSKREKRAIRYEQKRQELERNRPSFVAKITGDQTPRHADLPDADITPKLPPQSPEDVSATKFEPVAPDAGDYLDARLTWCTTKHDHEWVWKHVRTWRTDEWADTILPTFNGHARLTWREVRSLTYSGKKKKRRPIAHEQEVRTIAKEAQERWLLRELEQYDTAFRFRLGSKKRIWGFVVAAHFFVVWWDPKHDIYPLR